MKFAPTFCITFIFHFLWIVQSFQVKLMTILLQNFEGAIRYTVGDVQMANVKKGEDCINIFINSALTDIVPLANPTKSLLLVPW